MLRIWKALLWEFSSHAVHLAYAAVLVAIIGPWLGWALSGFVEMSPDDQLHARFPLYFSYVGAALLFNGAAAGAPIVEMPKFSKLHPVSSRLLATFFWLVPPCLIMLLNVTSQLGHRIIFGTTWPILTTTVCLGAFSTVLIAGGWWLTTFLWRRLAVVLLCVGLWVVWFADHFYGNGWDAPMTVWNRFTGADLAVVATTLLVTWCITLFRLKKYRCGENDASTLVARIEETPYLMAADDAAFALTPLPDAPTAFLDMEWTRVRHIVRGLATVIIGVFVVLSVFARRSDRNDIEFILLLLSLSTGYVGLAVGAMLGGEMWAARSGELKSIHSTLPFSDAQLGRLLLRAWLKVTTVVWLMVVVATPGLLVLCGIVTGMAKTTEQVRDLWLVQQQGWLSVIVLPAASFLLTWTLAGISGSVVLTGRRWLGFAAIIVFPTVGLVFLVIYSFFGEPGQRLASALWLCLVVLVACGGTACVYANAVVRRLLTANQVFVCAAAVLLLCAATWVATPSTIYWKTFWTALVCLSAAPIASMPSALAWNRHR
ncbi:MAG: hypothetical protein ABGZ53_02460 [Fuerstiella sp.]